MVQECFWDAKWVATGFQRTKPALRLLLVACIAWVAFGAVTAHAAPLTFGTTNIALTSPSTTLTIASGSTADSFTVNATSVVVSLSASGGNSFVLTSPDYDLSVATTSGSAVAAALDCAGGKGEAGTAGLSLRQVSGSATYTITPTGGPCIVPIVTTGGITIYPIVIHVPEYASTTIGDTLEIPISTTDPNGYPVSLSAVLPPDAIFSTSTGSLVWGPRAPGVASATIQASDKVTQTTATITLEALAPAASRTNPNVTGTGSSGGAAVVSTSSNLSIEALKTEIAALERKVQELLAEIKSRSAALPESAAYPFTRDLTVGSRGSDVRALQIFLVQQDTGPAARALGANGTTRYFGPLTRAALAEYQAKVGIKPPVGYFGPITRAHIRTR